MVCWTRYLLFNWNLQERRCYPERLSGWFFVLGTSTPTSKCRDIFSILRKGVCVVEWQYYMLKEKSNILCDTIPFVKGNIIVWGIALQIACLTQKNVILDFYEFVSFF